MNLITNKTTSLRTIILLFIVFSSFSCAKKVNFQISSVVPAARGFAKVKKDKNNNNLIDVQLSGLAEVNRLQTEKKTYVVWLQTDLDLIKNIGQINSSTGLLSKQLKANFKTVSTHVPVKIFITAEDDPLTENPSDLIIISTERFNN